MIAAYGFQKRWRGKLVSGKKRMTIRARRKDGRVPKVGDTFRGYIGMRSKQCELVVQGVVELVRPIKMLRLSNNAVFITVAGKKLSHRGRVELLLCDGFESYDDFLDWFLPAKRAEFAGLIIEWRPD